MKTGTGEVIQKEKIWQATQTRDYGLGAHTWDRHTCKHNRCRVPNKASNRINRNEW